MKAGIRCRYLYNAGVEEWVLKDRNSYRGCGARRMPIPVDTPAWIMVYADLHPGCGALVRF